mgnify:CR=1 FL=1
MDDSGLELLKQEMQFDDIILKVNAIHRMKTVILAHSEQEVIDKLIPYINGKCSYKN